MRSLALALFLVAGCSGSTTPMSTPMPDLSTGPDLAMCKPDPNFPSQCGKPCDKGNSGGVGKFCQFQSDCAANTLGVVCSQLGDQNNYFCTSPCDQAKPIPPQCGENAICQCDPVPDGGTPRGCGCYPTSCIH